MRYFFHIRDADGLVRDDEGTELPDIAAARNEARLSAQDFAMNDLKGGATIAARDIEIADDSGQVLATMSVKGVVN